MYFSFVDIQSTFYFPHYKSEDNTCGYEKLLKKERRVIHYDFYSHTLHIKVHKMLGYYAPVLHKSK